MWYNHISNQFEMCSIAYTSLLNRGLTKLSELPKTVW